MPKPRGIADRLREVFHQTIGAFQLQPQFFRVLMMLDVTTDSYAADLFQSTASQFHCIVEPAFGGPLDEDRKAILVAVDAVLASSLRSWVMNRLTIQDVYANVDNTIRLIYEYRPS